VPPSFNPGGNNRLEDYFPGPLYIDAITLDVNTLGGSRFPLDRLVTQFAGDKPFGVRVASGVPAADVLAREVNWRWMLLSPAAVSLVSAGCALVLTRSRPSTQIRTCWLCHRNDGGRQHTQSCGLTHKVKLSLNVFQTSVQLESSYCQQHVTHAGVEPD
jgi:hypothetical protein